MFPTNVSVGRVFTGTDVSMSSDESCQQPPGIAPHQHKHHTLTEAQETAADLPLPCEYSQIKGEKCLKIQLSRR